MFFYVIPVISIRMKFKKASQAHLQALAVRSVRKKMRYMPPFMAASERATLIYRDS